MSAHLAQPHLPPGLLPPLRPMPRGEIIDLLDRLEEWLWRMMSDPTSTAKQRAEIMTHVYDPVMKVLVACRRRPYQRPPGPQDRPHMLGKRLAQRGLA